MTDDTSRGIGTGDGGLPDPIRRTRPFSLTPLTTMLGGIADNGVGHFSSQLEGVEALHRRVEHAGRATGHVGHGDSVGDDDLGEVAEGLSGG